MKKIFNIQNLILFLFFFLLYLPILKMIIESFMINWTFNLSAYQLIIQDQQLIASFFNSFILAICNVIITIFISLQTIKYFFFYKNNNFFLVINYTNIILPEIIIAIAMLLFFTITHIPLGMLSLLICHVNFALSYSLPLLYQKWNEFDKTYILTAYDLGANKKYIWKTIIFPYLKPTTKIISFICFILSFDDYIFFYFCSGAGTNLLISNILNLLRLGISPALKALFSLIFLFSTITCLIYLFFNGVNNEKKIT